MDGLSQSRRLDPVGAEGKDVRNPREPIRWSPFVLCFASFALGLAGCASGAVGTGGDDDNGGDGDADADTDSDADTDTGSASDSDSDSDSDTDSDADVDSDSDTDGDVDDPDCGAADQPCCTVSSPQPTSCDSTSLTCLSGFPGSTDSYCWYGCSPLSCLTLEGESGGCHVAGSETVTVGICIGTTAEACTNSTQCQNYFGVLTAECVAGITTEPVCVDTGCNYQSDCDAGYSCSASDALCLPLSMML
jgi:hypothetical protein